MSITSPLFFIFLLAVAVCYYLVPGRYQWVLLLVVSVLFYLNAGAGGFLYLLFTSATCFAAGIFLGKLDKKTERAKRKLIVFVSLLLNFGLLFLVKYVPSSGLLMPLGLSYYMFQASGYVVDCYRKKYEPEKNFFKFLLFISFFPQVIQGPISRYNELAPQLFTPHKVSAEKLRDGIQLMMWGYFKKLIIANRLTIIVSSVYGNFLQHTGSLYLLATVLSVVQTYCDFSGGIDIVSGAAFLLSIKLPLNFRRPFFSTSLADYWQRWHISLYTWLRDYLFYSLAFSKPFVKIGEWSRKHFKGKAGKSIPTTLASFAVYFAIGIWHGAGAGYFAFAVFNAAMISISNMFPAVLKTPKPISILRTWILVVVSEFMIRAENLRIGLRMLSNVFTNFRLSELAESRILSLGIGIWDLRLVCASLVVLFAVELFQEKGYEARQTLANQRIEVQWLCILIPLIVLIFFGFVSDTAVDAAFVYGNF